MQNRDTISVISLGFCSLLLNYAVLISLHAIPFTGFYILYCMPYITLNQIKFGPRIDPSKSVLTFIFIALFIDTFNQASAIA